MHAFVETVTGNMVLSLNPSVSLAALETRLKHVVALGQMLYTRFHNQVV